MQRATAYLAPGHTHSPTDQISLVADERRLRRKLLHTIGGNGVLVDFPQTLTLEHCGALLLENTEIVEIIAAPELLYQIEAQDGASLVQLAWHIGNRHTAAQLEGGRILIKRDHVLKTMLQGLGARIADITEPFFPVHGAYHAHGETAHALSAK
ncbi:urease accessory protein UreE [Devosia rhodophyticola]|uniref:Urease accessory protein UreE n=1 Tax=Devosia rhodophyticola TaxID=3026423 RepID=A0ABY7YVR8_9HYPH|nr:urease accessory protein UreE [Devosia rhodophyticola]WDR05297.1 urease accessory protein UreE [Devosia rhodophyticola]